MGTIAMINKSTRSDVVLFDAEGLRYQAIWKEGEWNMAAIDESEILEMHTVAAPRDATPGALLKAWWKLQRQAGTFQAPPQDYSYEHS
jgi:hypothetical protein